MRIQLDSPLPAQRLALFLVVLVCMCSEAVGETAPTRDVVFASPDAHDLKLNLFLPDETEKAPLVVFIHGGGWRAGSYERCPVKWLTEHGFAVASIGYRLTDKAIFPAQVHDCKAAVRWLRAHEGDYNYDASHITAMGTSAGGHLALMLGVTAGDKQLEGEVGDNTDASSEVQAVVDFFGPSDFLLRTRTQPSKTESASGSVYKLLGGKASDKQELARLASPAHHVGKGDPPLLVLHGENDRVVLIDQAQAMVDAYKQYDLDVEFIKIPNAVHGGNVFFNAQQRQSVVEFLNKHLKDSQ